MQRLILFLSFLCLLTGCKKNSLKEIEAIGTIQKTPSEVAKDIEFILTDSAKIKMKLLTPEMQTFSTDDPYVVMPKGLKMTFYYDNLVVKGLLRANYGIEYRNKKTMEVKDNVVVVNTKGDTFTTEELTWNEKTDRVYSDKFVRVKTKDEIIMGKGFSSDLSFINYEFRDIRGIISMKNSRK